MDVDIVRQIVGRQGGLASNKQKQDTSNLQKCIWREI